MAAIFIEKCKDETAANDRLVGVAAFYELAFRAEGRLIAVALKGGFTGDDESWYVVGINPTK